MTAHSHSHAQAHSCTIKTVAVAELAAAADRAVQINPLNAPSIQMVRALGIQLKQQRAQQGIQHVDTQLEKITIKQQISAEETTDLLSAQSTTA